MSTKEERLDKQAKRAQAATATVQQSRQNGGLKAYLKGVRTEMKKVVWPTRKDTVSYTVVVVFTCVVFALLFWGLDTGFLALLKAALNITL